MNSAKQKSKIAFNQQAPTYDCDIKGQHARTLYPVIINRLKSISYQTALDLGCGTGEVMKLILQQDNSKILYGLDLSEKMLEIAQKKLENRATLILGDSEQLPFSDCFFDVVYCNDSFHHYPAPERALSEIDRVLKPNGTFILCDCWQPTIGRAIMNFYMKYSKEGDVKIYSESEICKLLSRHFSNVTWERVGNTACMACGTK